MRSVRRFGKWQTTVFSVSGSNLTIFNTSVSRESGPVQNIEVGTVALLGRVSGTAGFLAVFSLLDHSGPRNARHNLRRNDGVHALCFRASQSDIAATSAPSSKACLSYLTAFRRRCGAFLC